MLNPEYFITFSYPSGSGAQNIMFLLDNKTNNAESQPNIVQEQGLRIADHFVGIVSQYK